LFGGLGGLVEVGGGIGGGVCHENVLRCEGGVSVGHGDVCVGICIVIGRVIGEKVDRREVWVGGGNGKRFGCRGVVGVDRWFLVEPEVVVG